MVHVKYKVKKHDITSYVVVKTVVTLNGVEVYEASDYWDAKEWYERYCKMMGFQGRFFTACVIIYTGDGSVAESYLHFDP